MPGTSGVRALARNPWFWTVFGAVVVAVAGLAWVFWPAAPPEPAPRARQYLEYTACLLTGERGLTDTAAGPVWAGLQDASLATHAKVQYLAITGPQTVDNGVPFLNTLAQTGCNLIFAAGDVAVATVDKGATNFPDRRFYPVGGGSAHANVFPITTTGPDGVRAAVSTTLTDAVR